MKNAVFETKSKTAHSKNGINIESLFPDIRSYAQELRRNVISLE